MSAMMGACPICGTRFKRYKRSKTYDKPECRREAEKRRAKVAPAYSPRFAREWMRLWDASIHALGGAQHADL